MPQPHTGEAWDAGTPLWTFDGQGNLILKGGLSTFGTVAPDTTRQGQKLIPSPAGSPPGTDVAVLHPSGDSSGTKDATSIQFLLNQNATFRLGLGVFWVNKPLRMQVSGQILTGSGGATASGNDAGLGLGTTIKATSTFSTTLIPSGPPNNAVIMMLDGTPGTGGATYGLRIRDLWVDGSSAPANVDGVSGYGAVSAFQLERVGVYGATGDAFPLYSDTGASASPDGPHLYSCIAQSCTGNGYSGKYIDATALDCHAQLCGKDGFTITGANNRWIACRADLNTNGFTFDAQRPAVPAQFHDTNTLVGCGTQANNKNGLNVINSSASGQSLRYPVIADACSFEGDGSNSGAGGGGFAGIAVSGRNTVFITNPQVLVMTYNTAASPQYSVATASSGTGPGVPDLVTIQGGFLNAVTAITNDAAPTFAGGFRISNSTMVYAGGEFSSQATTQATPFAAVAAPFTSAPTAPASTVSATLVMMGLGTNTTGTPWAFTPKSSGVVLVTVTGLVTTATAVATATFGGRFGTGAAPVNGAAVSGTRFGGAGDSSTRPQSAGAPVPFALTAVISLIAGTAYWFDIALDTSSGSDAASVSDVSISIFETS